MFVSCNKQRHKLFADVDNDITNSILMKRPKLANNDDITIVDYSKITKVKIDNIAIKEFEITGIEEALSQKEIYERFHAKGIFSNNSDMTSHCNGDGTSFIFCTATICDIWSS